MTALFAIRETTPEDAEALVDYIRTLLTEPGLAVPLEPEEFTVTAEEQQKFLGEAHGSDHTLYLIAEAEGEIVGEFRIQAQSRRRLRHAAELGLSVRADWRKRGVGSAFMERGLVWAKASPVIKRLQLHVYASNATAVQLYEKFGFEVEGRRKAAVYQDGVYLTDLIMARNL